MKPINSMKLLMLAGAAMFAVTSAMAADPTTVDTKTQAKPDDTSKRVCRIVTPTGSRFTARVCKTAAEWERDAEKVENNMDQERRGNSEISPNNNAPR